MKVMLSLMGFMSAIALCFVLHITSNVFIPLVIAWFILQILRPAIQIGKKLKFKPLLNIVLVFGILTGLGFAGFKFLAAQVIEFGEIYNLYSEKLSEWVINVMAIFGIPPESVANYDWLEFLKSNARNISELVIALFSKTVMTLVFLMFMILESPYMDKKIEQAFGHNSNRVKNILNTISEQVSRYLGALTLISLATGICAWIVLTILGVKLAAGWGVLTVLLNFIPTIGSIIATIPPVVMAIIQYSPSFFMPLLVLALLTAIQVTIGNIITPQVVGDRIGVSPVVILLSLLLWGTIWGIPGALLSVPIISIIKIICENIPSLRSIAVLIGSGSFVSRLPAMQTHTPEKILDAVKKIASISNKNTSNNSEEQKTETSK